MDGRLGIAGLAVLTLALAGCGGGVGGPSPDPLGADPTAAPDDAAAAAIAGLADVELTSLPCGWQFAGGPVDQTVRIEVWRDVVTDAAPLPGIVTLGVGGWSGRVVLGRDLAANWCDDVLEPGEPTAVIDAERPLTGTLTWQLTSGDGACPSDAVATLTDLSVEVDDGSVAIDDLTLTNDAFGCFAG